MNARETERSGNSCVDNSGRGERFCRDPGDGHGNALSLAYNLEGAKNIRSKVISDSVLRAFWLFLLLISYDGSLLAGPVGREQAGRAASTFLEAEKAAHQRRVQLMDESSALLRFLPEAQIANVEEIRNKNGKVLSYVCGLQPGGFVIVAADDDIAPILGFSFTGRFPLLDSPQNALLHLVQWDVQARLRCLEAAKTQEATIRELEEAHGIWARYLGGHPALAAALSSTQTWPSDRAGWIRTQWRQSSPFNDRCPWVNPAALLKKRCAVGCVATAFSQILNYWKFPPSAHFGPDDAYTSNGNAGSFAVDADHGVRGFPSFADLSGSLAAIYYDDDPTEEANLCFSAGIKLAMNYGTKSSSFTSRAADAFKQGFNYGSAQRASGWDNQNVQTVIRNMKAGWPVQAGISDSQGRNGGHSVVIDGYRSDGQFHVNFGWGGSADAWYALPHMPAPGYDVVHTVVYDIVPFQGWNQVGADQRNSFRTKYPVPTDEPQPKWQRTIPGALTRYSFGQLVVGTGGRINAALNPNDQGQSKHPYVYITDAQGSAESSVPITDSDYSIDSLVQNRNGDVYLACAHGTYNTRDKTVLYRIANGTKHPVPVFEHATPDPGWPDEVIKIDGESNVYLIINPYYPSNGSTLYSLDPQGRERWHHYCGNKVYAYANFVAIDEPSERVYLAYWDENTRESTLVAFHRGDGSVRRTYKFPDLTGGTIYTAPRIGESGTLFIGQYTKLYAFSLGLSKKWTRDFYPAYVDGAMAVAAGGTLYCRIGKVISSQWHPGYIMAIDPSNGSVKWDYEVAPLGANDYIGDVYVGVNGIVLLAYRYKASNEQRLVAVEDCGSYGRKLWDIGAGGSIAFGPGNTIYTIPFGVENTIVALSVGKRGDPDGLGMAYLNNSAPDAPLNPAPADGESVAAGPVTLSWSCSDPDGQALKYRVFMGDCHGGGGELVPVAEDIGISRWTATGLNLGVKYMWKVVASDGQAFREGQTWTFATMARVTRALEKTYNLVSVPFSGTALTNAEALALSISNCSGVWRWDAATQGWSGHPKGGPNNFALAPGDVCLVSVTAPSTFEVSGLWATFAQSLKRGYNLICVPQAQEGSVTNAEALAVSVPNCTGVWRWDAATQGWSGHPKGGPNNFALDVGHAYLVYLTADGIW